MPRRSARLESTGYYDSEGNPVISYRESMCRIFRRRRTYPQWGRLQNDSSDNISIRSSIRGSIKRRNSSSSSSSIGSSISSGSNMSWGSYDSSSVSRGFTALFRNIFGFLLLLIPLCFGLVYLIPTLSSNVLDSGPSVSTVPPASPDILTTDFTAGCDNMAKRLRELQDEVLGLKAKMNYLFLEADTMPNFALESLGASVLFQWCSPTYQTQDVGLTFFGILIWRPSPGPRTVIKGNSSPVPGQCWAFAGEQGHLSIALSHQVAISHVTMSHISKNVSPTGSIAAAPKEFSVYGMETLDDEETKLGTFLYDQDGDPVQTFKVPDSKKGVFNFVKLQVESNWGHPDYTCLYGFRVHGKLAE